MDTSESTMKTIALSFSLFSLSILSACNGMPSEECGKYIDCQAHFDEVNGNDPTDLADTYGEGGSCWANAETAESCSSACDESFSALRESLEAAGEELGACE